MVDMVIVILFAVISIVLLSGKGSFLIAGYNTSSPGDKAKYDEKKLCRATGIGMLFITVLSFIRVMAADFLPDWYGEFFIIAILVDIAVLLYWTNKKCFADEMTVQKVNDEIIVVNGKDKERTEEIYEELIERCGR